MYNSLPWWLTWIDGRALLLIVLIAGVWAWYFIGLNDTNTYNDQDQCKACNAHISEPHDPDCVLDREYNDGE